MTGKLTVQTEELFPETRSIENHQNAVRRHDLPRRVPPLSRRANGGQAAPACIRWLGCRMAHVPGLLPDGAARRIHLCPLGRAACRPAGSDGSSHRSAAVCRGLGNRVVFAERNFPSRIVASLRHDLSGARDVDRVAVCVAGIHEPVAAGLAGAAGAWPHPLSPLCAVEPGLAAWLSRSIRRWSNRI